MRPSPLRNPGTRHIRGVALIIVLAFVVLLTGLVIAFFSRSLSERQISNSSAGQVKIDLFTQGAIATITSDLKREIAAGSNSTYYVDSNGNSLGNVYLPTNPATAVPALALAGKQTTVTSFPANLIKRSAYNQDFFPANSSDGSSYQYYNNGNTTATVVEPTTPGATPSPSAAPAASPSNRAAALNSRGFSTTIASPNGRAISPARWNKALLLPKSNPSGTTDNTPYFADPGNPASTPAPSQNKTEFVPPDWILVARDGSNPGSSSTTANFTGTVTVNNPSPSNAGYVTGRFAYAIYDEGGLLDANVAGYPTAANPPPYGAYPSGNTTPLPMTPTAKTALSYADLTIPVPMDATATGSNLQPLLTAAQVNALVGWRNFASSQSSGSFPNYTPGPTADPSPYYSHFDNSILTNLNGFIGVNNTPLFNGQSDRMFGSRQELINFFTQGLPISVSDTVTLAALQNSLQYFGTFSRSLNQPSYAPVSRVASATNPNPRPLIQPSAATGGQPGGGNNVGDNYTTPVQQDIFSPNLLSVRAEAAFTRNDGTTTAVVGEPLVKNRFALQRLAWLTFAGPIASNDGSTLNPTGNADVTTMITALENTYGLTAAYLKKGTAANIKRYFGLQWDAVNHCWKYNVDNGGSANTPSTGYGAIMKLRDIADQKLREPDFFELLKASVDPGALGKAGTNAAQAEIVEPNTTSHVQPLNFEFYHDVNVDAAIIQLGANIIDQYDLDGYPTRIVFDDRAGGTTDLREFHGVENLPYIYRIRTGSIKAREAVPASQVVPNGAGSYQPPILHSGTDAGYTPSGPPLTDTGAGIIMAVPDIWNPYDQNSLLGTPRPGTGNTPLIRLVANSAMPDTIYTDTVNNTPNTGYSTYTSGGFVGTDDAHGDYRGSSYAAAVTPDVTAKPAIPYFTRGANNATGTLSASTLIMSGSNGGFNNPHVINTTNATYLTFKVPNPTFFREPTMLGLIDTNTNGTGLTMVVDPSNLDLINLQNSSGAKVYISGVGIKSLNTNPLGIPGFAGTATQGYIGIALGTYPLRWVGPRWSGSPMGTLWNYTNASLSDTGSPVYAVTYSLQYQDPLNVSNWISYDDKYVDSDLSFVDPFQGQIVQPKGGAYSFADPRTPRFGSGTEANIADAPHYRAPLTGSAPSNWASTWLDKTPAAAKLQSIMTERPDYSSGFGVNFRGTAPTPHAASPGQGDWGNFAAPGIHSQNIDTVGGPDSIFFQTGLFAQNDPNFLATGGYGSDGLRFIGDTGVGARDGNFWSDPDGVVRRAMGAYVTKGDAAAQPLATATTITNGVGSPLAQSQSRPMMLNRPFRSVAELGYVFSGNPWKNIDFSTPESGYSEMLDVFCVSDTNPPGGLVAGAVNLNSRQAMVIKSILTGSNMDEENNFTPAITSPTPLKPLAAADADKIAKLLVNRTSVAPPTPISNNPSAPTGPQPLQNVGDVVGRWNKTQAIVGSTFTPSLGSVHDIDGSKSYDGFSGDLATVTNWTNLTADQVKIPRMRESAMRALSNVGNTRVWNLMIDVIAQSGRFPSGASTLNNFVVEGEQRYWVHLAIDRYTGAILDTKLEVVKE